MAQRLGHISKGRIKRLVSSGVLDPLDFLDFKICGECIKGKQTNIRNLGANRSLGVLEAVVVGFGGEQLTVRIAHDLGT